MSQRRISALKADDITPLKLLAMDGDVQRRINVVPTFMFFDLTRNVSNERWCRAVRHAAVLTCALPLLLFSLPAPAGDPSTAPSITKPDSDRAYVISRILDRFENETGYRVGLAGRTSDPNTEIIVDDSRFPRSIEGLSELLGIESYASVLDADGSNIRLIVVRWSSDAAKETDQWPVSGASDRRPAAASGGGPALTDAQQASVAAQYQEWEETGPGLDTTISYDDRLKVSEQVPVGMPNLTPTEEAYVLSFYEEIVSGALDSSPPTETNDGY